MIFRKTTTYLVYIFISHYQSLNILISEEQHHLTINVYFYHTILPVLRSKGSRNSHLLLSQIVGHVTSLYGYSIYSQPFLKSDKTILWSFEIGSFFQQLLFECIFVRCQHNFLVLKCLNIQSLCSLTSFTPYQVAEHF